MTVRKNRGILDPRYFRHPMRSLWSDYTALVEFYIPSDADDDLQWDEEQGRWVSAPAEILWRGMARIAPNKDWRARTRDFAGESAAEHAVRFQLDVRKNLLVPRAQWTEEYMVDLTTGHMVRVISNPNDPALQEYTFVVRNAIGANDSWHRTILCDANLGGRYVGSA